MRFLSDRITTIPVVSDWTWSETISSINSSAHYQAVSSPPTPNPLKSTTSHSSLAYKSSLTDQTLHTILFNKTLSQPHPATSTSSHPQIHHPPYQPSQPPSPSLPPTPPAHLPPLKTTIPTSRQPHHPLSTQSPLLSSTPRHLRQQSHINIPHRLRMPSRPGPRFHGLSEQP